ncbi:hypothetical protein HYALB_00013462 [Hymenoscyphus albidus]|uniref:Uncharacterized protein n=1 Tax=Hymenoscyphus albidus TaxID=595503 RepID=A0A9N9LUE8_9HELO|nr:hypothetical protein HYALB_00013462 [Hymenoscyphus albidus]
MKSFSSLSVSNTLVILSNFVSKASALAKDALCYNPDGIRAPGNYPCFLGQAASACCGEEFICEASGLCKVPSSVGMPKLEERISSVVKMWEDRSRFLLRPYYRLLRFGNREISGVIQYGCSYFGAVWSVNFYDSVDECIEFG